MLRLVIYKQHATQNKTPKQLALFWLAYLSTNSIEQS